MKIRKINYGMTEYKKLAQGPCFYADNDPPPLSIKAVASATKMTEEYGDFKCSVCGQVIFVIACFTHEEEYEIGHSDRCPHRQVIKENCRIED